MHIFISLYFPQPYKSRDKAKKIFSTALTGSKSLSAGPVRLRAWIWLLVELTPTVVGYIKFLATEPLGLRAWICLLINESTMYSKSPFAGPVGFCAWIWLLINMLSPLAPGDKFYLPTTTCHCRGKTPPGRGGCTKATNTVYKNATQTHFS